MGMSKPLSRWFIPNKTSDEEQGFSLRIIEFDDQGELWDPCQLDETVKHIKNVCGGIFALAPQDTLPIYIILRFNESTAVQPMRRDCIVGYCA